MSSKTVLILGGGVGGIVAANALRQQLKPEYRVIVIDKNIHHAFAPSFLWVMVGARKPKQAATDLRRLLKPGVELVQAEVSRIDVAAQKVEAGGREWAYDYLIVALGAALNPEAVPGLAQAAHTSYTLEGAARLWEAVKRFPKGRVAVVVARLPYKCPAAPYETALLLEAALRDLGRRDRVQLDIYTPELLPMPSAGPEVGSRLKTMLEARGIGFHPNLKLGSVNLETKELLFEDAPKIPYDLLVAVPPHQSPTVVRESGLANETGWIPVDPKTLKTKHQNVYALGDVALISLPGRYKPDVPLTLPKAGVFAHLQAEAIAHNIAAELEGKAADAAFDGYGYCFVELGHGQAAIGAGNFYAVPAPKVDLRPPGRLWHLGKVLFEQYWLASGPARRLWKTLMVLGGKSTGLEVKL